MRKYLLPLILSLIFLILHIFILSDYGINWDAPQRMLRGQSYAQFFLTGQKAYQETAHLSPILITPDEYVTHYSFMAAEGQNPAKLPERPLPRLEFENAQKQALKRFSFYQNQAWNGDFYFKGETDVGHPPLIDSLAALSNRLFFGKLGILGDIESYQLLYILIGTLGIFIVSAFALEITNSWVASLISALSLGLFPLFFSEIHFNMKDPLQAVFFSGAIWTFYKYIKNSSLRWFVIFVGFIILALGVKWNIIFLPAILLPWLFLIRFKSWGKLGKLGILGILGIGLFLIAIWPATWSNPIQFFLKVFQFYQWIGVGADHAQPPGFIKLGFNIYPIILLISQTPEVILILFILGISIAFRKQDKMKTGYLLFLWFLVPLIRYILPGVRSYNGIRQIMEIIPAMAVIAGVGANYLLKRIKNLESRIKLLRPLFLILIALFLLIPILHLHPNENVYFNSLVGGLKGAKDKGLIDWSLTYGNVYKQGVEWLNAHGEKDANLAIVDGRMFAASNLWLREDISISPYHFSGLDHKGEYIMGVFDPYNQPVFAARFPGRFLTPVHLIEEDGIPLLYIYKNDLEHTKNGFNHEESTKDFKVKSSHLPIGDYIELDLGKKVKVTRIILEDVSSKCNVENFVYIDEFIGFDSKDFSPNLKPSDFLFALNERRLLSDGKVEFSFPAEETRMIKIYPKSEDSCFVGSKISSVSYLEI